MRMTSREVSAMCTEYNEWKNLRELKQSLTSEEAEGNIRFVNDQKDKDRQGY